MEGLKKVLNDPELSELVRSESIAAVQLRRKALVARREAIVKDVAEHPRICNQDITKDFRYRLGMIAMADEQINLAASAQKLLEKNERSTS